MRKSTLESFLVKAAAKFGGRYDYSKVQYKGVDTKIVIVCAEHGEFTQTPYKHLSSKHGCPACASSGDLHRVSTADFTKKATALHAGKYDYTETVYKGEKELISYRCPVHGEVQQTAGKHIKPGGAGCTQCGLGAAVQSRTKCADVLNGQLHDRFTLVGEYTNDRTAATFKCCKCGHLQERVPSNLLSGQACVACGPASGFDDTKAGVLYYLKLNYGGSTFFKIGITNRSVVKRYTSEELACIEVLKVWEYPLGIDARLKEVEILKMYKNSRYYGPSPLKTGNTELFCEDVLGVGDE